MTPRTQEVRYIRLAMKIGNTEFTRRLLGRGSSRKIIQAVLAAHPELESVRIIEEAGIGEGETFTFIGQLTQGGW